jgi:O-antigen ligase
VVAALILTFSRGAWLAAGVGIGVLLASGLGYRVWQGIGIIAMAVLVSLLAMSPRWIWHTSRLWDLAERGQPLSRLDVWRVVPEMIASRPLLGSGLGTFSLAFAEATGQPPGVDPMPFAHNLVLNAAVELGVVGLAALLVFLGVGVAAAMRWHRRSRVAGPDDAVVATVLATLLTMLGHQMVDGTIMGVHLAVTLFALLGLAAAGDVSSRRDTAGLGGQRL